MNRLYRHNQTSITHWQDANQETLTLCGVELKQCEQLPDPNAGKPQFQHSSPFRFITCRECRYRFLKGLAELINQEYSPQPREAPEP